MKKGLAGGIAFAIVATSAAAFADGTTTTTQVQTATPPATTSTTTTTAAPIITTTQAQAVTPVIAPPSQTSPIADPSVSGTTSSSVDNKDTVTLYQHSRPNKPWLYTGGVLFVGSYVPTVAIAAANDSDKTLYIPVVGPWLTLADMPANASTTSTVVTAGSGILQGAGVLMMAASLFIPEKVPAATIQAGNVKMNVSPMGAVGTF